ATLSIPAGTSTPLAAGTAVTLTLPAPARDDVLGWAKGQWVEISTQTSDLQGLPGVWAKITNVQGTVLTAQLRDKAASALTAAPSGSLAVTVRRWDSNHSLVGQPASDPNTVSPPPAPPPGTPPPATPWRPPWIALENGISVQLGGTQSFKPG